MTFEECLVLYEKDIRSVIAQYARRNWRLERDDLYQEACLELWQQFPQIASRREPRSYVKHVVARRMKEIIASFKRDALFNAVSLDQLEGYEIDIDAGGKTREVNPPQAPNNGG